MDWVLITVIHQDEILVQYASSILPRGGEVINVIPSNRRLLVEKVEHIVNDASAVPDRGQLANVEVYVTEI